MKPKVIVVLGLFAFLAAAAVYAQPQVVTATVDFPFMVEGKALPSGSYTFTRDTGANAFRVQGEGKNGGLATVYTRINGELHNTMQDAHIVFDVIEGKYILSEIWIPGEDGYLLTLTKGEHKHKVINVNY